MFTSVSFESILMTDTLWEVSPTYVFISTFQTRSLSGLRSIYVVEQLRKLEIQEGTKCLHVE